MQGRDSVITQSIVDLLVASRSIGLTAAECSISAGISEMTRLQWVQQAKAETHRRAEGLEPYSGISPDDSRAERKRGDLELKIQLMERWEKATIVMKSRALATWNRAATTDWRAARSLLISSYPREFAPNRDLVKAIESGKMIDAAQANVFLGLVDQLFTWAQGRFNLTVDEMNEMRNHFATSAESVLAAAK